MEHNILEGLESDLQRALDTLLEQAIDNQGAAKGTLQVYNRKQNVLRIISQKGFDYDFLEHFSIVRPFDSTSCGRAAGTGNVVQINDVRTDASFAAHRHVAASSGFAAVCSFPLFSRTEQVAGVLSVHFSKPLYAEVRKLDCANTAYVATLLEKVHSRSESYWG